MYICTYNHIHRYIYISLYILNAGKFLKPISTPQLSFHTNVPGPIHVHSSIDFEDIHGSGELSCFVFAKLAKPLSIYHIYICICI